MNLLLWSYLLFATATNKLECSNSFQWLELPLNSPMYSLIFLLQISTTRMLSGIMLYLKCLQGRAHLWTFLNNTDQRITSLNGIHSYHLKSTFYVPSAWDLDGLFLKKVFIYLFIFFVAFLIGIKKIFFFSFSFLL